IIAKKFTKEHEWVSFDSDTGIATISITNHAQNSLGDVVFVELPTAGEEIKAGEQIGAVESVKAASDIYAPVSGVIEEVNEQLDSVPSLLNKSPEGDGWLCKLKATNPAELDALLTAEAYAKYCEGESEEH
ncbi:glycine cleavage H-protein, partial [Cantharellus anzutake]|uniref:glycine cleavage H-protein n=1 Tax=Cantharellus anzutake TaxID=1750568 RepID=UPI001905917D